MNRSESRFGKVVKVSEDKGPFKLVTVESEGNEFDMLVLESSGIQASPMKDGMVYILPTNNDNGQVAGFVLPPPKDRVDQQKEGEAQLKNHKHNQYVKVDDNGDVVVNAPGKKVIVTAGNIEITGEVKITGNITLKGNITQEGGIESTGVHKAAGHV